MKKLKFILAALIIASMLQVMPAIINVQAGNDTSSSSLGTSSEKTIRTIDIHVDVSSGTDITSKVQQALDVARDFAMDSVPYNIIIPEGTYKISAPLEIYSNTQITATGAHIIKQSLSGGMLRTTMPKGSSVLSGYSGYKNIKIVGGTWDGNAGSSKYGDGKCAAFSSFRFAHATNICLENVSVTNNVGSHHVEFGGVDGITVTGCTFEGYTDGGVSGGKEAIQLDVMCSSDVFVGYPDYDDTPCINVKISNNTFKNVNRGVGNHTAVSGVYFENIEITDNSFEDITQQAVIALNWKGCKVSGNSMKNVGAGVDFKYMESDLYYNPKAGGLAIDSDAAAEISDNVISLSKAAGDNLQYVFGIRAWGAVVTDSDNSNSLSAGAYYIEDVSISNNKITSSGKVDAGISGKLLKSSSISGNTVDFSSSSSENESFGIHLKQSSGNTVEKNTCKKVVGNGIHLTSSNENTIKSNTVTQCTGSGISLNTCSNKNTISGGSASKNSVNGISLNSSGSNTVKNIDEIKSNGGYGISVSSSSSSNKISKVSTTSNKKSGISISGSSSNNTLSSVTSKSNSGNGLLITGAVSNKVSSSTFSNNGIYGITISGSSKSNKVTACTSNGNESGQAAIIGKASSNSIDVLKTESSIKGKLPAVPQNVKLSARTSTSITIKWSKSKNASGYYIYRKDSSGSYKKIKTISGGSSLSFIDSGLTQGTSYSYRVTAYNSSSNNNTISSSYAKTVSYSTLPSAPSGLTSTSAKNSVTLKWSKVSGATGYYVYMYDSSSKSYSKLAILDGESNVSVKVTNLKSKTTYKFKVTAYKKADSSVLESGSSKVLSAATT